MGLNANEVQIDFMQNFEIGTQKHRTGPKFEKTPQKFKKSPINIIKKLYVISEPQHFKFSDQGLTKFGFAFI